MANSRMAGDKLDEPTKESADAKEALSRSEQNKRTREEIGNDPERMAERISGVDREAYDFDGYTDKEINMAMQGSSFGDKDYARLTGNPIDDDGGKKPPVEEDPGDGTIDPPSGKPITDPPRNHPAIPDDQTIGPGFGVGGQNINQNNDINSTVTGSNNTVTNTQDNSIRSYGAYGTSNRAKMLRDQYVADVSRFARAS